MQIVGLRQATRQKLRVIEEDCEKIFVVGDLHGDFRSYSKITEKLGREEGSLFVFLGDFADRGDKGFEIIESLMEISSRENVILLKGNHEDYSTSGMPNFYPCDLIYEVKTKWGDWDDYFRPRLKPFLDKLYLAAIVPYLVLFVHGGISSKINSLNDLNMPSREVEMDVLWSDPYRTEGEYPNPRGAGVLFGPDVTKTVCERLNVKKIVRSHEPRKSIDGPHEEHDKRVITISSTRVYGGKPFVLAFDGKNLEKYRAIYL